MDKLHSQCFGSDGFLTIFYRIFDFDFTTFTRSMMYVSLIV